ncbi:MAG TPA: hypothetical protein VN966_05600 [Candidatus Bathyarchaeia archaeon]|nr:hypothetical protein [Candidatus Bathyarchaeia archaeon]
MANFDQLIVSVSGRLTHQWDFTFYKNNGEIANRLQAELGSAQKQITIDREGDLNIETSEMGTFYVTPGGVVAAGWVTDSKSVLVQQEIGKFTRTIELLAKAKGSFTTESYNVRLFFRFRPGNSLSLLREHGFKNILESILGDQTPSDTESFKFSTSYRKGGFLDSLELEATPRDVQLRYSRSGADFVTYHEFLDAVDLAGIMKDLKPFAEVLLLAEPRGLLGRIGSLSEMK